MFIVWPYSVPLKLRYGLEQEYEPEGSKAVTEMDGGNKLRRNRFDNAPMLMTLDMILKDEEYEDFLTFYMTTLNKGVRNFIAPVLYGTRVEYHRCNIDNPSIKPVATDYNRWTIPMVFEVRDMVPIDEGAIWFIDYYGDFAEPFCDALQIIVNEDYPNAVEPLNY